MTMNTGRMRWTDINLLMAFYITKRWINLKFIIKKDDLAVKLKTILSGLRFALKDTEW